MAPEKGRIKLEESRKSRRTTEGQPGETEVDFKDARQVTAKGSRATESRIQPEESRVQPDAAGGEPAEAGGRYCKAGEGNGRWCLPDSQLSLSEDSQRRAEAAGAALEQNGGKPVNSRRKVGAGGEGQARHASAEEQSGIVLKNHGAALTRFSHGTVVARPRPSGDRR